MPGCSSPPVISASRTKRARLSGWSACRAWIAFSATSRFSSPSRATKTSPSPPLACGRRIWNRVPSAGAGAAVPPGSGSDDGKVGSWARLTCSSASAVRRRSGRFHRRQAALGVLAVLFQMPPHHRVEQFAVGRGEGALVEQDLPQRFGLVQDPGVHGGDQGVAADEVHLQRQDAEQKVAVTAHGRPLPKADLMESNSADYPRLERSEDRFSAKMFIVDGGARRADDAVWA